MSSNWPYSTGAAASAKLTHSRNRVKVQCPGCGRTLGEVSLSRHAKHCHGAPVEYVPRAHNACKCGRFKPWNADRCYRCEVKDERLTELDVICPGSGENGSGSSGDPE